MNLDEEMMNRLRDNTKNKVIILTTPLPRQSSYRKWWEETIKKMQNDPNYVPNLIPSEKEIKKFELD